MMGVAPFPAVFWADIISSEIQNCSPFDRVAGHLVVIMPSMAAFLVDIYQF